MRKFKLQNLMPIIIQFQEKRMWQLQMENAPKATNQWHFFFKYRQNVQGIDPA